MRFGLSLPHFGEFADAALLAEWAHEAEEAGWEGFFIWDHVGWGAGGPPMVDPQVALTAIAMRTNKMLFGPMVTPLPRRRPTKVARETVSLDRISGGRFVLGVGIGLGVDEWDHLGEETDLRVRGAMLDEALEVITALWSGEVVDHQGEHYTVKDHRFTPTPVQQPRIPVWVAATWPTKQPLKGDAPFRRAARWDGIFPIARDLDWDGMMSPQQVADIIALAKSYRTTDAPFEVVLGGMTLSHDPSENAAMVAPYAEVGVTWWLENIGPWLYGWKWEGEWPIEAMRNRIRQGPPR